MAGHEGAAAATPVGTAHGAAKRHELDLVDAGPVAPLQQYSYRIAKCSNSLYIQKHLTTYFLIAKDAIGNIVFLMIYLTWFIKE